MNYEELYGSLLETEKQLKDKLAFMQRLNKNIGKETENGDLKSLVKDIAAIIEANAQQMDILQELKEKVDSFDTKTYFESGDFTEQMLAYCEEQKVDVRGEFPVYEMFPYKVRIDAENQDVYIDRKKVPCMRPKSLIQTVKNGQDKLMKASFNAQGFLNELADAYDLAVMKLNKGAEADIYLTSLYKFLAPMSRFRKEYDQQSFAFDIARLYAATDVETTKNGRHYQFGPSRNNNKALRILDSEGREQFLATIRFFSE